MFFLCVVAWAAAALLRGAAAFIAFVRIESSPRGAGL